MGSAWRSGGRSTWRTAGRGCGLAGWGEGGARFRLNAARTASRPTATGTPSSGGGTPSSGGAAGAAAASGVLPTGAGSTPIAERSFGIAAGCGGGTANAFSGSTAADMSILTRSIVVTRTRTRSKNFSKLSKSSTLSAEARHEEPLVEFEDVNAVETVEFRTPWQTKLTAAWNEAAKLLEEPRTHSSSRSSDRPAAP